MLTKRHHRLAKSNIRMQNTPIKKTVAGHRRSLEQQHRSTFRAQQFIIEDTCLPASILTDSDILRAIVRACTD